MKLQIQTYLVLFFLLITVFSVSSQETDESTDIPSLRLQKIAIVYRDYSRFIEIKKLVPLTWKLLPLN